jgi:hypothetical protein
LAYEAITRLEGVQSVSQQACSQTWTGQIQMKKGVLPDLKAWSREFRQAVGQAFIIRGTEVTVDGTLTEYNGRYYFRVSGSNLALQLGTLKHKVQWDPDKKCAQIPTCEEQNAYHRLAACLSKCGQRFHKVQITGVLEQGDEGGPLTLTVREFIWKGKKGR